VASFGPGGRRSAKPTPPPPKSKKRLDWQKMVVTPLQQALKLAKQGPKHFEAAAKIADGVGDAVAEFTRTLDEQRPEQGAVYHLLRMVHSLYWELHVDPGKGRKTRSAYASDFPGHLVDSATWIDDLLKKRVAAKPDDSHLLGAWKESFSGDAKEVVDQITAKGEPKTALDSRILVNKLENVDTVTGHLITAGDMAEQLSPLLNKIH
jgi:hypothetical protein